MKKLLILALALSIALILSACGGDDSAEEQENQTTNNPSEQAQEPVEVTDEEKIEEDASVVNVNGKEVKGDKYNPIYMQVKTTMQQSGQDISNLDQIKEQTVNLLIEQELILQDAEKVGIEVSEEEVQTELDSIKEQSGEQLTTVLDQLQITEDQFKSQLNDDLITTEYMEQELEVEVTDKEVEEFYNQLKEQSGEEVGEMEELEEQIRQQIKMNKTQEKLMTKVEELQEQAEVEKLI
ncbi:SurA N-terminal domain-containing protein [Virgibacillus ainsalahensis]